MVPSILNRLIRASQWSPQRSADTYIYSQTGHAMRIQRMEAGRDGPSDMDQARWNGSKTTMVRLYQQELSVNE
ncbi:hypothetical protein RvY_11025 [Ramazzottius varieornatus]|uniref:Uncharacterized protein n=1 Tax=Ramazzottius varieornatus TaxID=947166 RepID=A0A1D1VMJ9_RAMVA|nr:hypothetical protein RvY_11025 [Ramazzottius varieornatus]